MAWINHHPAPGFGDLLPGWFVVPQNPITQPHEMKRVQGVGEFLPARLLTPYNPLLDSLRTVGRPAGSVGGGKVGLMGGLGEFNLSDITGDIGDAVKGISTTQWLMIGGAVLVLVVLVSRPGRSQYREAVARAKEQYRSAVAAAKRKYPRTGGRISRAYRAAAGAY
jgi:hypothetical protein